MDTINVVVIIVAIVMVTGVAVADLARAKFVLANMAEVGVPPSWLPVLGGLKAAGAAGLAIGLLAVRPIGIAAAVGLVLFFIGAVTTHLRAHVYHNIAFPGTYLLVAIASLTVAIGQ